MSDFNNAFTNKRFFNDREGPGRKSNKLNINLLRKKVSVEKIVFIPDKRTDMKTFVHPDSSVTQEFNNYLNNRIREIRSIVGEKRIIDRITIKMEFK